MVLDRATSHLQAGSSNGVEGSKNANFQRGRYGSPCTSCIERNLGELTHADLLQLAKQLKYPSITTLRLFVYPEDQPAVAQFFGGAEQRTADTLFTFSRALTHAIEGWMQTLELGVCLGRRDITSLCPAIRCSRSLRHLSFANSRLGDVTLQLLSSSLQQCRPLQILNLSGCALTDVSAAVITAIVKGVDLGACSTVQSPRRSSPLKVREPKFGQLWRQSAILIGKWSPPPELGARSLAEKEPIIPPKAEEDWRSTLRKPVTVGAVRHEPGKRSTNKSSDIGRLVALDISCNSFTDFLSEELCPLLYRRPPLRALNLRCNQMTRAGAKPLLDVMKEMCMLRLIDFRGNKDDTLLGVLENGEHFSTFSTFQSPFWMTPESLHPTSTSTKSQANTSNNRSKVTPSPWSSVPEKQGKAAIISQHVVGLKGGGGFRNLSPPNSANRAYAGASRNRVLQKVTHINTSPPRANTDPSCSGASVSRAPADHQGPSFRQNRNHESTDAHLENEGTTDFNDNNWRFILTPGKERPVSTGRVKPQNATRSKYPKAFEPPGEHLTWDEYDLRDVPASSKVPEGRRQNPNEHDSRRAQSAGYNCHRPGYPRDCNYRRSSYNEYGHQNCGACLNGSDSPSRPSTRHSQGRGRSLDKTPIRGYHHRSRMLNYVHAQKRRRSKSAKVVEEQRQTPVLGQLRPRVAPLPDEKKELVEWNNFVNQMTTTLLNLKDGLDHLVGPTKGAVAQQAATKLNQMPTSFFRSGMMRLLERSCKVLNSHVTSLTKRHKESMLHYSGALTQTPIVEGKVIPKEKVVDITDQAALAKQEKGQLDKSQETLRV